MSVRDLCRNVRSQWVAFSRMVWPEDSGQLTQATIEQLDDELARRYRRLLARRRRIEAVRDLVSRQEGRLREQPDSLSLREAVVHNRDCLAELENAYARRRQVFARRKKLLKAMRSGRVVADADPT